MHLRETGLDKVIVIVSSFNVLILGFQDVYFNHITYVVYIHLCKIISLRDS